MKGKKQAENSVSPSVYEQKPTPETSTDLINNYGTYNIQPTADTENMYPAIAQGYHAKIAETDCENKEAKKRRS